MVEDATKMSFSDKEFDLTIEKGLQKIKLIQGTIDAVASSTESYFFMIFRGKVMNLHINLYFFSSALSLIELITTSEISILVILR